MSMKISALTQVSQDCQGLTSWSMHRAFSFFKSSALERLPIFLSFPYKVKANKIQSLIQATLFLDSADPLHSDFHIKEKLLRRN